MSYFSIQFDKLVILAHLLRKYVIHSQESFTMLQFTVSLFDTNTPRMKDGSLLGSRQRFRFMFARTRDRVPPRRFLNSRGSFENICALPQYTALPPLQTSSAFTKLNQIQHTFSSSPIIHTHSCTLFISSPSMTII